MEKLRDSNIISTEQFTKIEEYIMRFPTDENRKNSQKRSGGSNYADQTEISRVKRVKGDLYVGHYCIKRMM